MALDFNSILANMGGPDRSPGIERPAGVRATFEAQAKRSAFASKLAASGGRPSKVIEALAQIDPAGGSEFVTESEVYAILSSLGVVGLTVQPLYSWTDTWASASNAVSEQVTILPGMALVIQVGLKGADLAAAGALAFSVPALFESVKVGTNNVNNGHPIPFRLASSVNGRALLVYEFTESDGTGTSLTGNVTGDLVTNDDGLIIGTLFRSMASAQQWLDRTRN